MSNSIRDALESAIEAQENDTIDAPAEAPEIEIAPIDTIAEEAKAERDESGKFKAKESNGYESPSEAPAVEAESAPVEAEEDETPRPSTWKKEYLPLWDKARKGEPLSVEEGKKFTNYLSQREREYQKGVSAYKAEADRAKSLEDAIAPFIPELQSQNISPSAWINNLGRAHVILTKAPYNEKVAMFHRLAGEYGIQFDQSGQLMQQTVDPYQQQLMQQLQQVNQEVSVLKSHYDQQRDANIDAEIAKFKNDKENYPYFSELQNEMAQLLAQGHAGDLKQAYDKALRFNDEVWGKEQEKLLDQTRKEALKQAQIQKAKSAAVSVKTTTPSGVTSDGVDKKDRRAVIGSAFDNIATSRV